MATYGDGGFTSMILADKTMFEELWKPIKNYEGFYEISNTGLVKSLSRKRYGNNGILKGRILRHNPDSSGYLLVVLHKHGKRETCKVHHLVWDNFTEESRNGYVLQLDHIDGDKKNNNMNNLQLLSNRANIVKYHTDKRELPVGVYWHKERKKYYAKAFNKFLGLYCTLEEARLKYLSTKNMVRPC